MGFTSIRQVIVEPTNRLSVSLHNVTMKRIAECIDSIIRRIGNVVAWAMVLLMVTIVTQVILHEFRIGIGQLEELQWHLYAVVMMIGMSYAFLGDAHIRVDVFQHRFSDRARAGIDIAGSVLLLLPFLVFLLMKSWPFVQRSYLLQERSNNPDGLPFRWIIKAFIPLTCVFMMLAVASRLIRCWATFRKR